MTEEKRIITFHCIGYQASYTNGKQDWVIGPTEKEMGPLQESEQTLLERLKQFVINGGQ